MNAGPVVMQVVSECGGQRLLVCAGVSGGSRGECVGYGGVKGRVGRRAVTGQGLLVCARVSGGSRGECVGYGGVKGRVGRRAVTGWQEKRSCTVPV
nr:hypothetical protein [Tanacetum cinerariifolium]